MYYTCKCIHCSFDHDWFSDWMQCLSDICGFSLQWIQLLYILYREQRKEERLLLAPPSGRTLYYSYPQTVLFQLHLYIHGTLERHSRRQPNLICSYHSSCFFYTGHSYISGMVQQAKIVPIGWKCYVYSLQGLLYPEYYSCIKPSLMHFCICI